MTDKRIEDAVTLMKHVAHRKAIEEIKDKMLSGEYFPDLPDSRLNVNDANGQFMKHFPGSVTIAARRLIVQTIQTPEFWQNMAEMADAAWATDKQKIQGALISLLAETEKA